MGDTRTDDTSDIFYVCELIEALDRRLPQPERAGEAIIARQAAALRRRAVRRLAELRAEARHSEARHSEARPARREAQPRLTESAG